eukprot:14396565-Alexandrium_andersonii.AAC.1
MPVSGIHRHLCWATARHLQVRQSERNQTLGGSARPGPQSGTPGHRSSISCSFPAVCCSFSARAKCAATSV